MDFYLYKSNIEKETILIGNDQFRLWTNIWWIYDVGNGWRDGMKYDILIIYNYDSKNILNLKKLILYAIVWKQYISYTLCKK